MIKTYILNIFIVAILVTCNSNTSPTPGCDTTSDFPSPDVGCTDIELFGLDKDITLGQQFDQQIHTNDTLKAQYPLLDSVKYATAYGHLRRITDNIVNSGKVIHKCDFPWKIRIIQDDKTLNAFCIPGGIIYVYTGLIKYLDKEDDLAGVMAHEIGHADMRHSTKSLVRDYGFSILLQLIGNGSSGQVTSILSQLALLKYSRCHEAQADAASVTYLSGTSYRCNGAASFFQKLLASNASEPPVFLSDHPGDQSRFDDINARATKLSCNSSTDNPAGQYQAFKSSLP